MGLEVIGQLLARPFTKRPTILNSRLHPLPERDRAKGEGASDPREALDQHPNPCLVFQIAEGQVRASLWGGRPLVGELRPVRRVDLARWGLELLEQAEKPHNAVRVGPRHLTTRWPSRGP